MRTVVVANAVVSGVAICDARSGVLLCADSKKLQDVGEVRQEGEGGMERSANKAASQDTKLDVSRVRTNPSRLDRDEKEDMGRGERRHHQQRCCLANCTVKARKLSSALGDPSMQAACKSLRRVNKRRWTSKKVSKTILKKRKRSMEATVPGQVR